jgi:uncharacterized protein (DUF433 family)/DNA-binding XRE family transcriptional regulator
MDDEKAALERLNQLRTEARYTVSEVARIVNVHARTVHNWLYGQETDKPRVKPVLGAREPALLSFLDLIEIAVVAALRSPGTEGGSRARLPLDRIRRAHSFARKKLNIEHPFASRELFATGTHIFHEFEGSQTGPGLLAVDLEGQYHLPEPVDELGRRIEFDFAFELAERWFPRGRHVPIVVDPRYCSGRPAILGRNLHVEYIARRFHNSESIPSIAEDLSLEPAIVEEAIRAAA